MPQCGSGSVLLRKSSSYRCFYRFYNMKAEQSRPPSLRLRRLCLRKALPSPIECDVLVSYMPLANIPAAFALNTAYASVMNEVST